MASDLTAAVDWWDDPAVVSWDWKEQPDIDTLATLLASLGVRMTAVDTGSDTYAVHVTAANPPVSWIDDGCHEEVSRRGMAEPCDRPAIAMADDPEGAYPVCQRHIRGRAVPLAEYRPQIVAEVTRQVKVRLLRDLAAELRRERCVGGIEYVDAAWLDARADQISRGGGERG